MSSQFFGPFDSGQGGQDNPKKLTDYGASEYGLNGQGLTVFCFTWNTQSHHLSESADPAVLEHHRSGYLSTWNRTGVIPDFWQALQNEIIARSSHVVVISFQEDAFPGSYFHSHFLPEQMTLLGYHLFDRTKLMGVGKTTVQGFKNGQPAARGLRMSVYLQNKLKSSCPRRYSPHLYTNSIFKNKGGIAIYLPLPNRQVLALINVHLPFDSNSLRETVQQKDLMIRQNALFEQNQFLNELYQKLVLQSEVKPNYVLMMGDFNYRYFPFVDWSAKLTGEFILESWASPDLRAKIRPNDELFHQMTKGNIYPLEEGPQNQGPSFLPTGKMSHARIPGHTQITDYCLGNHDHRVPNHCDRILYTAFPDAGGFSHPKIECREYQRFDQGMMVQSDHAGVYGMFVLT